MSKYILLASKHHVSQFRIRILLPSTFDCHHQYAIHFNHSSAIEIGNKAFDNYYHIEFDTLFNLTQFFGLPSVLTVMDPFEIII